MAKPYREGTGWATRVRYQGQEIYLSGFPTKAAADKAERQKKLDIDRYGAPKGLGPERTTEVEVEVEVGLAPFPRTHLDSWV